MLQYYERNTLKLLQDHINTASKVTEGPLTLNRWGSQNPQKGRGEGGGAKWPTRENQLLPSSAPDLAKAKLAGLSQL